MSGMVMFISKWIKKLENYVTGCKNPHRRGSAEQVLIMVILTAVLILPLGVLFNRMLQTWYLYRRAQQTIVQILPSASLCLDPDDLSEGRLRLGYAQVEAILHEQLERNVPPFLHGQLLIKSVQIEMVEVPPEKINWITGGEPQYWPVITCHAELTDPRGKKISFSRSVSCVIE